MKKSSLLSRTLLATALLLLAPFAARADNLSLVFTPATQTVAPGGTITFSGKISNTSSATIVVNGDSFTGFDPHISTDDSAFFNATSFTLTPGATYPVSGSASLFDVTLDSMATPGSTYSETFNILGGANSAAQELQGNAKFFVTVAAVPETSTTLSFGLLLAGGVLLAVKMRRQPIAS